MRFVVAQPGPSFSVHDVYVGWCEALRQLDQTVIEFNLDDRITFYSNALMEKHDTVAKALTSDQACDLAINGLFATLYTARPDVLLVVSGFFVPPGVYQMARAYGTKVVVVHTESPYEDDRQSRLAPFADVNIIDDPTNLSMFPPGTVYMPKAYRPSLHTPGPSVIDPMCDLSFVGTAFQSRIDFFEAMELDGLDVVLAGNWQALPEESKLSRFLENDRELCMDNDDTVDVYRSSKCGINLYRREAHNPDLSAGWSMGPREVEMAAIGLFFLRDPRGEGDEVLHMLPTFTSPGEASDLLRWYLNHPAERAESALKAREAIAPRTFRNHAVDLLRLLDK